MTWRCPPAESAVSELELSVAESKGFEPLVPLRVHLISKPSGASEDCALFEKSRANGDPSGPEIGGDCPDVGQSRGNPTERNEVESALASALAQAASAGRFDVVAQLARELEARRLARMSNVIAMHARSRRPDE